MTTVLAGPATAKLGHIKVLEILRWIMILYSLPCITNECECCFRDVEDREPTMRPKNKKKKKKKRTKMILEWKRNVVGNRRKQL
jgi:hypothetical protein